MFLFYWGLIISFSLGVGLKISAATHWHLTLLAGFPFPFWDILFTFLSLFRLRVVAVNLSGRLMGWRVMGRHIYTHLDRLLPQPQAQAVPYLNVAPWLPVDQDGGIGM